MKKLLSLGLLLMLPTFAFAAKKIMSFDTMYGVDGAFINNSSIRGVQGDELPWQIKSVHGSLSTSGWLDISIHGLVFPNIPSVPAELRGINDEKKFRAIVSCLTGDKSVSTKNIITKGFAASRYGNSHIHTKVKLGEECIAPIIFIVGEHEQLWFAVTGAELESDKSVIEEAE